jgi:hypothetical protein
MRPSLVILPGHTEIESTVRCFGVDVEDALSPAERTEVQRLPGFPHVPGGKPTQPASAHVGQSAEAGSFAKADDKVGRRLFDHHGCELTSGCSRCVVGRTNWQGARNQ